jgi:hypothetical protein
MRRILLPLLLLSTVCLSIADAEPMPQTARQALIEMFFSKTPGTLDKHLPEALRTAIKNAPPGSVAAMLNAFSAMATQVHAQGSEVQTFDTGSILLSVENPAQHSKLEIVVDHDDLQGTEDDIAISFRGSKDGEPQFAGINPRFVLAMKQESDVWRLHDVTITFKISLTSPDLLKAMATPMKPSMTNAADVHVGSMPMQPGNESTAIAGVRTILTAETTYAASYPTVGYTCSLSNMGGMGGTERSQRQAMLIDPRLQSGKKNGYVFKLEGCDGNPATKFRLVAAPAAMSTGLRTFCSDESAVLRSASDADSCFSSGTPVH